MCFEHNQGSVRLLGGRLACFSIPSHCRVANNGGLSEAQPRYGNVGDEKSTAFVAPLDMELAARSFIHLVENFAFKRSGGASDWCMLCCLQEIGRGLRLVHAMLPLYLNDEVVVCCTSTDSATIWRPLRSTHEYLGYFDGLGGTMLAVR
jgi:hypothetical protein